MSNWSVLYVTIGVMTDLASYEKVDVSVLVEANEKALAVADNVCGALLRGCRECGFKFRDEYRESMECPECNTPRGTCKQPVVSGSTKCRFHGGASLRGIDHPNYKGRGLSKVLPVRLLDTYEETREDPDNVAMSDAIAVLEARKADLISRADEEPGKEIWELVRKRFEAYVVALEDMNDSLIDKRLRELEQAISRGYGDSAVWAEIMDIEERLRRIRLAELKRREMAASVITESQFKAFLGYLMTSIKTRVEDPDLRMKLIGDISRWGSLTRDE